MDINDQQWLKLAGINEGEDYGVYKIKFDDLDDNDKQLVLSLQSHFKAEILSITTAARSGKQILLLVKINHHSYRFDKDDLQLLAEAKIRWMEARGDYINIGF